MTIPNTELFQKIDAQITDEPRSFYMAEWEAETSDLDAYWSPKARGRVRYTPEDVAECGTARCVAGWAVHLSRRPGDTRSLPLVAEDFVMESVLRGVVDLVAASNNMIAAGAHLLGLDIDHAYTLFIDASAREAADIVHHFAQGENDVAFSQIEYVAIRSGRF